VKHSQSFAATYSPNFITSYGFSVAASITVVMDKVKYLRCFLTSGTWDDYGSIGSYTTPIELNKVQTFSGRKLIAESTLTVNGTISNLSVGGCGYIITLEWEWEELESDCPSGYLKLKKDGYPGYCCIPCGELTSKVKQLSSKVRSISG
jgi:hypothetical protein